MRWTRTAARRASPCARDQAHAQGVWHGAVHVWVLTPDGAVILQRRARTKDLGGGKVDVSVGGHLAAGETWLAGLREAEEELGLVLAFGDVEHLGRFPSERAYPDGRVDREWQDELVAVVDQPLDAYVRAVRRGRGALRGAARAGDRALARRQPRCRPPAGTASSASTTPCWSRTT